MSSGGYDLPSWAPWPFGQVWTGHGQRMQSRGASSLRRVKGQPSGNIPQVLNPEQGQDEDDNVMVTDDSEKQLENEEVLAIKRQGRVGRHVGNGQVPHTGHPQDKSEDSEDNKNSESERESDEEESDEEDRDEDVDPGFREQLMAVLQAGKALVSRSRAGPLLQCACMHLGWGAPGCSLDTCPSGWSGRQRGR